MGERELDLQVENGTVFLYDSWILSSKKFKVIELDLQVENGTAFLYDSWIDVEFQLLGEYGQSVPITVPILVGRQDNQEYPIIGFNVIEEVVKQGSSIGTEHGMSRLVQTAFLCISEVKAMSFVNFMQAKKKESDSGGYQGGVARFPPSARGKLCE